MKKFIEKCCTLHNVEIFEKRFEKMVTSLDSNDFLKNFCIVEKLLFKHKVKLCANTVAEFVNEYRSADSFDHDDFKKKCFEIYYTGVAKLKKGA